MTQSKLSQHVRIIVAKLSIGTHLLSGFPKMSIKGQTEPPALVSLYVFLRQFLHNTIVLLLTKLSTELAVIKSFINN